MHQTSLENMQLCIDRYFTESAVGAPPKSVVDVGGADVNGSYRQLFVGKRVRFATVDMEAAPGVDIVLPDPYKIPLPDGAADYVISGQMLEHCEFFWLSFVEMVRILKPDGYLFLIAPSTGPIHRHPVDCYRFYPDAYAALAKYANCRLVECWHDRRGEFEDLVGVFTRHYNLDDIPALS